MLVVLPCWMIGLSWIVYIVFRWLRFSSPEFSELNLQIQLFPITRISNSGFLQKSQEVSFHASFLTADEDAWSYYPKVQGWSVWNLIPMKSGRSNVPNALKIVNHFSHSWVFIFFFLFSATLPIVVRFFKLPMKIYTQVAANPRKSDPSNDLIRGSNCWSSDQWPMASRWASRDVDFPWSKGTVIEGMRRNKGHI